MSKRNSRVHYFGPVETALVSVRAVVKDNVMACDWHSKVNYDPELYMISIGHSRFTYNMIKKSKCFVVNFMPAKLVEKVRKCGRISGKDVLNKFTEVGLGIKEAKKIDCPVVAEALAHIECKVIKEIDFSDHTIFVGEIVYKELGKIWKKRPYHLNLNDFIKV